MYPVFLELGCFFKEIQPNKSWNYQHIKFALIKSAFFMGFVGNNP